jgi:tetratricopeptide (TPR) repeat protein
MKNFAMLLLVAVVCLGVTAVADDEGHHHEEMTAQQLGTVHFPVSCNAAAQKDFEHGVALLHSFWYEEAEKTFNQVLQDDPKCAMAEWGIAMSKWHQLWNHPDEATIKEGLAAVEKGESLKPRTARERAYLEAIEAFYGNSKKMDHEARATAYSNAMEKVYKTYPDDHEAAIFYALSLLASEPDHDTTFVNRKKAAAILEPLFASEPNHPGVAHYLIHSYDKPQLAQLGLPAAKSYAKIAPAAPHALHMPSHIFARVGDWQDDIDSNLASIDATRKTAAMHMGGEGHQFHAMDFLVYAYLQSGREDEAWKVIEDVQKMPPMHDMYGMGFDPRTYALSKFPALYELELHHWAEAAKLKPVDEAALGDQAITYWARAIGAARSGQLDDARKDIAELGTIRSEILEAKKPNLKFVAEAVADEQQQAGAWLAHAEGKDDAAVAALRAMAEKEEHEGDESTAIPSREMLGDVLLEIKKPQQALAEYQASLKYNPNRFNGLYGAARAAEMAGKASEANGYYAQLVKDCAGGNSARPELEKAKQLVAAK